MGYQREFDPEIGAESVRACVNDGALLGAQTYVLSVNTTSSSLELPAGVYRVFLQGMSAAETLAMVTGGSGVTAALPTSGTPGVVAVFRNRPEVGVVIATRGDGTYAHGGSPCRLFPAAPSQPS